MGNQAQVKKEIEAEMAVVASTMEDAAISTGRIGDQYSAHMSLYNVAASNCDKEEMEKQRETLHSLLDHMLDNGAVLGEGQRDMQKLRRRHHSL